MTNAKDPKLTVLEFNRCINQRDIKGLSELMAEDYTFIDSSDDVHTGKENMVAGWKNFFDTYPDYRNHFELLETRGNGIYILGYSRCEYDPLDGPAIWTAHVENDLVVEWRVYLDTDLNRRKLGLPLKGDDK